MTITLTPETEQELQAESERQGVAPEQVAIQVMLAGLKKRHTPQTLAEIPPRKLLPPGMSLWQALSETPWPHDEPDQTDEEINRILEELG